MRIKEDNYTKKMLANTAKHGFSVNLSTPFTENLQEAEPTLANLTEKQTSVSIVGEKSIGTYVLHVPCMFKEN